MKFLNSLFCLLAVAAVACGSTSSMLRESHSLSMEGDTHYFVVDALGQEFVVAVRDVQKVDAFQKQLEVPAENRQHVLGYLDYGDGGFNKPYSWHIKVDDVDLFEMSTEVCDGLPVDDVENHLDYWVETVKNFCPWSSFVKKEISNPETAALGEESHELCEQVPLPLSVCESALSWWEYVFPSTH